MWAKFSLTNFRNEKFSFTFEIKVKEDDDFFKYIWGIIKKAVEFILNFFTAGQYRRCAVGKANSEKINKISKICVWYNRSRFYNPVTNNCQRFVKNILNAIESDFSFQVELGNIILKLENEGKVDFIFRGRTFNTRKELNDHVKSINFNTFCANDKILFICYKNTFNIYLRNNENEERFKSTKEVEDIRIELIKSERENLMK